MMSQLLSTPYPPVLELCPSTAISGLPPDSYTIFAVAGARIYHAQLSTKTPEWCYSRMRGTLVFGKDCEPGEHFGHRPPMIHEASSHWFRLLDSTTGKPLWIFKVSPPFVYEIDRPFFHVLQGKSRRFGFLLDDDDEADLLAKKVKAFACPPRVTKNRSLSFSFKSIAKAPSSNNSRPPIVASMISLPAANTFAHLAHVGLTPEGTIEATAGIDPAWTAVLDGYSQQGHSFQEKAKSLRPGKRVSFEGLWRCRESEGGHSRGGSMTELVTLQGAGTRPEKHRRRLPPSSFTMF